MGGEIPATILLKESDFRNRIKLVSGVISFLVNAQLLTSFPDSSSTHHVPPPPLFTQPRQKTVIQSPHPILNCWVSFRPIVISFHTTLCAISWFSSCHNHVVQSQKEVLVLQD
jgi:hypothetical protein